MCCFVFGKITLQGRLLHPGRRPAEDMISLPFMSRAWASDFSEEGLYLQICNLLLSVILSQISIPHFPPLSWNFVLALISPPHCTVLRVHHSVYKTHSLTFMLQHSSCSPVVLLPHLPTPFLDYSLYSFLSFLYMFWLTTLIVTQGTSAFLNHSLNIT